MLKLFKDYGVSKFIWHYINVIVRKVSLFWPTRYMSPASSL